VSIDDMVFTSSYLELQISISDRKLWSIS